MKVDSLSLGPLIIGRCEITSESSLEFENVHPSEWELSKKYTHPIRKREFLLGRSIVHTLNKDLPAVLSTDNGMPLWSDAFTGSISHKNSWVIACVESREKFRSIGIDLEEASKFPHQVKEVICLPEESKVLNTFEDQKLALALVFSCKESLFKACYPLCKIWFGFHDARLLRFDKKVGTFQIELLRELSPHFQSGQIFEGYYKEESWNQRNFIISALTLGLE